MKNIELYDYQEMMLHRIEEELAKRSGIRISDHRRRNVWLGRTVMVQMPTGTGKTYVMAAVIRNVKVDGEVWIIAHRRELVEQMERTLDKFDLEYEEAKSVKDWKPARICEGCSSRKKRRNSFSCAMRFMRKTGAVSSLY